MHKVRLKSVRGIDIYYIDLSQKKAGCGFGQAEVRAAVKDSLGEFKPCSQDSLRQVPVKPWLKSERVNAP